MKATLTLCALGCVVIATAFIFGGYGALISSLFLAVGLADSTQPNDPTERVND